MDRLRKCVVSAGLGVSLALAPFAIGNLACGGDQKKADPPPPPPEPPPLEPKCDNEKCTSRYTTCPCGEACDCGTEIPVPNNDKYNEQFALKNALEKFWQTIHKKDLTEAEQKQKSDELKEIFVEAYSRDTFSANLPFSSDEIRKGLSITNFKFPYTYETHYNGDIVVGTPIGAPVHTIHETGHHWGLGEALAELLKYMYTNKQPISQYDGISSNFAYDAICDGLLAEKVGDKTFWKTVLRSTEANKKYAELWDSNMTVMVNNQEVPLVTREDFNYAQALGHCAADRLLYPEHDQIVSQFEHFAGFGQGHVNGEFFEKVAPVFKQALKDNKLDAITEIQNFFGLIRAYQDEYKTLDGNGVHLSARKGINEYSINVHLNAVGNVPTKEQCVAGQQSAPRETVSRKYGTLAAWRGDLDRCGDEGNLVAFP
jgi:hypothetical protein